jgi:signal transduction histidine kinase
MDTSFKYNNISVVLNEQEEIRIVGFPNEYSHVILNILKNAKDAIVAGGMDGQIILDLLQEKNSTVVKIRDNGGGISELIFPKIFNPYFTTKEDIKGTGIGLYMSKMIIEKHMNGYIDVKNVNDGAEFKISTAILKKERRNTTKEAIEHYRPKICH